MTSENILVQRTQLPSSRMTVTVNGILIEAQSPVIRIGGGTRRKKGKGKKASVTRHAEKLIEKNVDK